jgi:hypothetical protein
MKTAGPMSRNCFVTHSPTSVAPATTVASGSSARSVTRSAASAGRIARPRPSPRLTRAPSRIAASAAVTRTRSAASGSPPGSAATAIAARTIDA